VLTETHTPTPTSTSTPACSAPLPGTTVPAGFIIGINPANGAVNVPIDTSSIIIYFNQPMYTGGGNRDVTNNHYTIVNTLTKAKVPVLSRTYDPIYYALTIVFDNTSVGWRYSTLYEVQFDNQIANACGTRHTNAIVSYFTTGPLEPITPVPADSAAHVGVSFFTLVIDFIRSAVSDLWLIAGS
jgi:hypothetical protein